VYKQKQIYEAEIRKGQSRLVFGVVCIASAIGLLILDKIWSWCCRRKTATSAARMQQAKAQQKSVAATASVGGSTMAASHQSQSAHHNAGEFEYRPYR
jgi:hypothetical protein